MGMLARLGVVLGLDSAEFQKGIEGADRQLDKLVKNAQKGAAIASAAFVAMTYEALNYADQITDTAKANDMAVTSILALSQGLVDNGGKAEKTVLLLASFNKKVDEAATGSLAAQQAFGKMGVSLNDLSKLSIDKLFDKTLNSVAALKDPITRNATAMDMFGKAAKGVDFIGLANGTQEARDKFQQYAFAVEEAGRLHDEIKSKAHEMMLMFTSAVIPTLTTMYEAWNKNSAASKYFFDGLSELVKYGAVGINTLASAVTQLATTLVFMGESLAKVLAGDFKGISAAYDTLKAKNNALWADNQKFMQDIMFGKEKPMEMGISVSGVGRSVTAAKDPEVEKANRLQQTLDKAKLLSAEYMRQNEFSLAQLNIQARIALYPQREQEVIKETLRIRQQLSTQLEQVEAKIQNALIMKEYELADVLRGQKKIIEEQGLIYIQRTEQTMRAIQAEQYTFSFGWRKAFNQFNDDAKNYSKLGANAFSTFTNTIGSAIDQFATNGTLSFKRFALSVVQDISLMLAKFYAMQLAMMAVGFLTKAIGGMGGGLSGAAAGIGKGWNTGGFAGTTMLAAGGDINGPAIVGENGPELFIPKGSGSVIPNQRMGQAMQNQPSVTYNGPYIQYMSAIDTQSATQFLAKNKAAVWSANQSANRSVPVNR